MSSQGPKITGVINVNGLALHSTPTSAAVTIGYGFDTDSIRDAGDWTRYKKQLLVYNEDKSRLWRDPWFVRGNEYRLTWMQGRSKQPDSAPCVPCSSGSAFVGSGPF